ncbi:hypothetical protein BJ123_109101 [Rhodopseudomonas thermotolerans]|uniref:Uncharacterized protein n=2 Tax=Rhodopseudomonas TaxID=1073 RepID=A0A336JML1_9BRAD|nr:hypothetical protein BJ125_109101 [Rhodopseudomonas pentothenatexigens]REG03100.1 hypothetical protein BJ123_109101 [Rhodopseudomonas thermotolerans]SSW90947.1 hypothetical protein SAMN05892882_109101 [Rhodopseudomonas pentothenatexigens]
MPCESLPTAAANLSPLLAGRGRLALASRVRGQALRLSHPLCPLIGSSPSPHPSPRKSGARERAVHAEIQA